MADTFKDGWVEGFAQGVAARDQLITDLRMWVAATQAGMVEGGEGFTEAAATVTEVLERHDPRTQLNVLLSDLAELAANGEPLAAALLVTEQE